MAAGDYMTSGEFRARFPEFRQLDGGSLDALLQASQEDVNPCRFLSQTREAHGFMTAHKAALSPFGRPLKLMNADGSTNYSRQFQDIVAKMSEKVAVL